MRLICTVVLNLDIIYIIFLSIYRDPLSISLLLRSRHFKNIAFITDCVLEGIPGATIKYGNRQSKLIITP